jgi:uncharacterized membrane protein YqaE (UPF0057 family)
MKWQFLYDYQLPVNSQLANIVDVIPRQRGGDILNMILKPIEIIFNPIIAPFVVIGKVFSFAIKLIVWFVKFIIWAFEAVFWLFTDLLNPKNFIEDFFNGFMTVVMVILITPVQTLIAFLEYSANMVGNLIMGSFWGWDQTNLTPLDKASNYFQSSKECRNKKCYLTETNKVPFSIILGTVLCPPMGVFMVYGITGWLNILICTILTVLFYVPGLIYGLLIVYTG